jgi:drug/metabolite transporter (DMT)-like permease
MFLGLLGAFGAAVLYGAGTVLQAAGVRGSAGPGRAPGSTRLRSAGLYAAGLTLDALGFLASLAALRTLPLFVVQSAIASSVAVTAVLATVFLGSRLRRAEVVALGAVALGLVGLAVVAREGGATGLGGTGVVLLLAGLAPVVLLAAVASRLRGRAAASLLALVAGLGFAGTGVSARVLKVPQPWWRGAADPVLWCLVGYSLVGLVCYALALQRGSVTAVAAVTFTVETVVPAVIGLAWLGDGVRPGGGIVAAGAFALTLAGCLRLAGHASPEVAA